MHFVLGMLVASGRKSQMAIAIRAILLHAFYPFPQNKINSKFFSCGTVKKEKPAMICRQNLPKMRTKLIPPFLLVSFTSRGTSYIDLPVIEILVASTKVERL